MERGGSGHCEWQRGRSPGRRRAVPDRRCGAFEIGPVETAEPRCRPTGQRGRCAQQTLAMSPTPLGVGAEPSLSAVEYYSSTHPHAVRLRHAQGRMK
jgi:hypothetical protein